MFNVIIAVPALVLAFGFGYYVGARKRVQANVAAAISEAKVAVQDLKK